MLNVGQKVSELRRMTVGELRREYAEGGLPDRAPLRRAYDRRHVTTIIQMADAQPSPLASASSKFDAAREAMWSGLPAPHGCE